MMCVLMKVVKGTNAALKVCDILKVKSGEFYNIERL